MPDIAEHVVWLLKKSCGWIVHRYALSDEKTFASLFHPDKESILRLVDAFVRKDGKYAIPGYGHKLGLLLHGPPGTGKTSLIKACFAGLGLSLSTLIRLVSMSACPTFKSITVCGLTIWPNSREVQVARHPHPCVD